MARLIWTNRALDDLERLVEYIAQDAPVAARRFAQKIFKRVEQLQSHPESGGWLPEDETHAYREVLQGNYRVIYRVDEDSIYLVAVHHAARLLDVENLR